MKRMLRLSTLFVYMGVSAFTFGGGSAWAAGPKKPDPASCAEALAMIDDVPMTSFAALGESFSIADLPKLVQQYPTLAMDAAQIYYSVLKRYPSRIIRDPSYRIQTVREYPIFADGVTEAGGLRIIGQHEALDSFVDWVKGRAEGKRSSKMFTFLGPAGTGKTQVLNIIDRVNAYLATKDPEFFQWTFEFVNLDNIPSLRPLVGKSKEVGMPILRYLNANASPLVVLPESMQKRLTDLATPAVQKRIGAPAIPFLTPSPQTAEVIKLIVQHEMAQKGIQDRAPTEREYFEMIQPYIRIVRRTFDLSQPSVIVRAQGKSPEMSQLLISENLALSMYYSPESPLSYFYNGQIIRSQNGGLLLDEFQRQDSGIKNLFLEIVQNGVVEYNGAPAIKMNVVPVAADNDESVEAAKEEGAALAQLDRSKPKPMRLLREPQYIMKLAIEMLKPSLFKFRHNDEPDGSERTLDMNEVFPNATATGELALPDGKFTLYYAPNSGQKTLIAPRSLLMMALTVGATRLEVDPDKLKDFVAHLPSMQMYPQYFLDPMARLRVLLGKEIPEAPVLTDLAKLKRLRKEGANGISSRDTELWTNEILREAEANNSPVTPVIVDRAFMTLMEDEEIKTRKGAFNAWLRLHQRVKAEFILPMLTDDVSTIISGDSGRVDRMYDEIRSELIALDTDRNAGYYFPAGERTPINKDRLRKIEQLFRKMHNKDLGAGLLKNFHIDVTVQEKRYQPLLDTISRFLMQNEFDVSTLTEIANFFKGKTVSEAARLRGMHAEANLGKYGYDRESFLQALLFVRDQQAELAHQLNN